MTRKEKLKQELRKLKDEFAVMCAQYVAQNPTLTMESLATKIGVDKAELSRYCAKHGVKRQPGPRPQQENVLNG